MQLLENTGNRGLTRGSIAEIVGKDCRLWCKKLAFIEGISCGSQARAA
jgi:hypothetical protein